MKRALLVAPVLMLVTAACGGGGKHDSATHASTKTVDINMVDIAFQPTTLSAQRGERVEFVFHNEGKVAHDAFIGDLTAQTDHEREMRQGGNGSMGGGHDRHGGDTGTTVEPGKTGRLSYTFDRSGTIEIGCHQPGHYAAGMKVAVTVA